jgi:hypothetical protein
VAVQKIILLEVQDLMLPIAVFLVLFNDRKFCEMEHAFIGFSHCFRHLLIVEHNLPLYQKPALSV